MIQRVVVQQRGEALADPARRSSLLLGYKGYGGGFRGRRRLVMTTGVVLVFACSKGMDPGQQGDERKKESQRPRFDAETPANPLASV